MCWHACVSVKLLVSSPYLEWAWEKIEKLMSFWAVCELGLMSHFSWTSCLKVLQRQAGVSTFYSRTYTLLCCIWQFSHTNKTISHNQIIQIFYRASGIVKLRIQCLQSAKEANLNNLPEWPHTAILWHDQSPGVTRGSGHEDCFCSYGFNTYITVQLKTKIWCISCYAFPNLNNKLLFSQSASAFMPFVTH